MQISIAASMSPPTSVRELFGLRERKVGITWHIVILILAGFGLLAVGIVLGGTVAWYRAWDEGFREGFNGETNERLARSPRMHSAH